MQRLIFQYPSHDDNFHGETVQKIVAKSQENSQQNFFFFVLFLGEKDHLPFALFSRKRGIWVVYLTGTVLKMIRVI